MEFEKRDNYDGRTLKETNQAIKAVKSFIPRKGRG